MDSQTGTFVRHGNALKNRQRGFFDAGIGLALLALFSLTASVMVSHENDDAEQQVASCAGASGSNTGCTEG